MTIAWRNRQTRTRFRRLITQYFYSRWKPAALCFCLLGLLLTVQALDQMALVSGTSSAIASSVFLSGLCAIAFTGLVGSTIWNLMTKRYLQGFLSICLLIFFCYAANLMIANLLLFAADDAILEEATYPSRATVPSTEQVDTTNTATQTKTQDTSAADGQTIQKSLEASMDEFYGPTKPWFFDGLQDYH